MHVCTYGLQFVVTQSSQMVPTVKYWCTIMITENKGMADFK